MSKSLPSLPANRKLSKAMAAATEAAWARQSWYEDLESIHVVDTGGHWTAIARFRPGMVVSPEADRICRLIGAVAPAGIHEVIVDAQGNVVTQCLVIGEQLEKADGDGP